MHKVVNPFMGLQIETHIHARKVEEDRGKKNRVNIQGTLTIRVRATRQYLEQGKKMEKHEIRSDHDVQEQILLQITTIEPLIHGGDRRPE